jgi:hypothetical protein
MVAFILSPVRKYLRGCSACSFRIFLLWINPISNISNIQQKPDRPGKFRIRYQIIFESPDGHVILNIYSIYIDLYLFGIVGCHFTSPKYTELLLDKNIRISMDGKGRALDDIVTERLWRTIKYEEVYLKDYESPREARKELNNFIHFYNYERPTNH